ncbi:MAG: hypothetical protein QOH04_2374 [Sphingomonadales bacterium]|jgi:hypothetical protein|nr:hypothetical protein [Sphingomonadales bacterium]MEA3036602.1 hypothetical protein [Sphingomonadales bacterium]
MKRILPLLGALGVVLTGALADARPHEREQDEAFRGRRAGRFMPLRDLEERIVPRMHGFTYLGPELDAFSGRYRLKFMRGPQVVWIDIDARTGEILGRSGF